jgi:single-stranded DNA-specific DHH superfamily exonuclease
VIRVGRVQFVFCNYFESDPNVSTLITLEYFVLDTNCSVKPRPLKEILEEEERERQQKQKEMEAKLKQEAASQTVTLSSSLSL